MTDSAGDLKHINYLGMTMLESNIAATSHGELPSDNALALSQYALALKPDSIDASTTESVVRCVFDAIISAAAGFTQPGAAATQRAAVDLYGAGTSPIWFTGKCAGGLGALVSNSTAAAALDLDDGYRSARGHPGAAVIPAALAALHLRPDTSAQEFVAAVVAGYEVGLRLAMARPGYAPSGAWSGFCVAVAAGRVLGASPDQLASALGIVAQTAPALPALAGIAGSDVKEGIPAGVSAGWVALQLAMAGVSGPCSILDDGSLFSRDRLLENLGGVPLINGTYFKLYGCCRHIHAPVEALRSVMDRTGATWKDIVKIQVHTYQATFNLSNRTHPQTLVQAQYSVPFCVALCARYGWEALVPIESRYLNDTDVVGLARLVDVVHDPAIEPLFPLRSPARLSVQLKCGECIQTDVMDARGDPTSPLSWEELEHKLLVATRPTLGMETQEALLRGIRDFRRGAIAPLLRVLHGESGMRQ